jgi:hypothetical protein
MRNKRAKQLRSQAKYDTVGKPENETRSLYQKFKSFYKKLSCNKRKNFLEAFKLN